MGFNSCDFGSLRRGLWSCDSGYFLPFAFPMDWSYHKKYVLISGRV